MRNKLGVKTWEPPKAFDTVLRYGRFVVLGIVILGAGRSKVGAGR